MLWLKVILLFTAGLSGIFVGFVVLSKGLRKLSNMSFAILVLAISSWTLGIAFFLITQDPDAAFFWAKFYYLAPLLITIPLAVFVKSFPDHSRVSLKWLVPLLIGFFSLALPLLLVDGFLTDSIIYHD